MTSSAHAVLWFSAQVIQAGVLVALVRRGLHRQYRRFTAYILVQTVSEPLLTLASARWQYVYYYGYWATIVVTTVLTIAILLEIIEHVWWKGDTAQKVKLVLLWGLFLVTLIIAVPRFFNATPSHFDEVTSSILVLDRNVNWAICGIGLFILLFRSPLGVAWREFVVGVVTGFVLSSGVHILVAAAMMHRTVLHRSTLTAINSAAYVLAASIWLGYAILSPKAMLGGSAGGSSPRDSWPGASMYASLRNLWRLDRARGFPAAFRHERS